MHGLNNFPVNLGSDQKREENIWAELLEGRLALIQGLLHHDNSYVPLTVNPGLVLIRL